MDNNSKKPATEDIPYDLSGPDDEDKMWSEARKRLASEGYRSANLPEYHNLGIDLQRSGKTGREQASCSVCNEVFVADINGDRILFEDRNHRLILVRYTDVLFVCDKCLKDYWLPTKSRFDELLESTEQHIQKEEHLPSEFRTILEEMKKQNITQPETRREFFKKRLLKL